MALSYKNLGGTMSDLFQIGKGGPNIRNNAGVVEIRNTSNTAYAGFRSLGIQDAATATTLFINGNNHIGIGSAPASTSAVLEINSTDGALLVSRLTTAQRGSITPVDGMILYDSDTNQMFGRINGTWVDMAIGTGGINNVVEDPTPQLGGDLDVNGNAIVSSTAGNIAITPDTTGSIVLDGQAWPQADGTSGQVLTTDGLGQLAWQDPSGGIDNLVEDTTPQLGGDLDANGFEILLADGAALTPSLTFGADLDTGIYRAGTDNIGITIGGSLTVSIGSGVMSIIGATLISDGTVALPAHRFASDQNTGIYRVGADILGIAAGGDEVLTLTGVSTSAVNYINITNAITINGPIIAAAGDDLNVDLNINPKGTGAIVLDGLRWPTSDGTDGQVLTTNGLGQLAWEDVPAGGIANVVEDTTPQLGGDLDANGNRILISNGSVPSPGLAFGGDLDTGIYTVSANFMGFTAGGVLCSAVQNISGNPYLILPSTGGAATLPSMFFSVDSDTGIYRIAEDSFGITAGGVLGLSITEAASVVTITTNGPIRAPNGTTGAPSYSFSGDPNTGMYNPSSDTISLVAGGNEVLRGLAFNSNLIFSGRQFVPNGTVSEPTYAFDSDNDVGIYHPTTNTFGIAAGANEGLLVTGVASAVNYINITNAITANGPIIAAAGDDLNVDLNLQGKGTGVVNTFSPLRLGGDIDLDGWSITSTGGITVAATGNIFLDGSPIIVNGPIESNSGNLVLDAFSGNIQINDNLNVNGNSIVSTAAGNIAITPDTTGSIVLDGQAWPQADGTDGQVLTTNGLGQLAWEDVPAGGIANVVEDTTPQLGGDLDANGFEILLATGAVGTPSLTFGSDLDTGLYSLGADQLAITVGGVQALRFFEGGGPVVSTFAGQVHLIDGIAVAPALAFASDSNTGFYSAGADALGLTVGGTLRVTFNTGNVTSTVPVLHPSGTAGAPSVSFSGDPDTGVYVSASNTLSFSAGGGNRLNISSTQLEPLLPIRPNTGGIALVPDYSFSTDSNTGMYSAGADSLGFSTGGTLRFTISTTAVTPTLPILAPGGSATAPTYSFASDPDTGIYSSTANLLRFATGGSQRMSITTTEINFSVAARATDGSAATPSLGFQSATNTGLFLSGTNGIGFATNGTARLTLTTTGFTSTLPFYGSAGSAGAPSLSFSSDPDTGMYLLGANEIAFSTGGVIRLQISTTSVIFNGVKCQIDNLATVGAPDLAFSLDSDTGLYSPGADIFGIVAGGVEGLRITETAGAITAAVNGNLDVSSGLDVTGNITVTGTVDGVDLANVLQNVVEDTTPQLGGNLDAQGFTISNTTIAIRTVAGTTDTLVLADADRYVRCTSASPTTVTVPTNASVAFPVGTQVHVRQAGAGQVTIAAAGGVTINTSETLLIRAQHATITLIKVATDEWDIMGELEAA